MQQKNVCVFGVGVGVKTLVLFNTFGSIRSIGYCCL